MRRALVSGRDDRGGGWEREAATAPRALHLIALDAPERRGRPVVAGKFLEVAGAKLYVRGVTYGTFAPDADGFGVPDRGRVAEDFAAMAASGVNAVRLYAVPPEWLLDLAADHGLWVMVGLPWEDHVAFLQSRSRPQSIVTRVREGVQACRGHEAVLAYAVGNEISSSIARWHGPRRVEDFIERLYDAAKGEDPDGLVTYVNYPTTEYLHLPFLDFASFNVFLEQRPLLEAYLARLQTVADERPVVLTELGLDSRTHGLEAQAETLSWQISTAFEGGCAGAFVFAWTDEWHRGELDVRDWDFGLVDRDRRPKPALGAVSRAYAKLWSEDREWPRISVVVCTHNGSRTLGACLDALDAIDYPDFELIVVDDGSTDGSGEIASARGAIVVRNDDNEGLSESRNRGAARATGEIVAYLDDDAYPDPHWLRLLAVCFSRGYDAVGGPNLAPPDDSRTSRYVADAPGGPVHVLLSDVDAEHVPGCNMALRRDVLAELGGFDPRFRIAGDDVDVCWRLRAAGHRIGFSGGAMVWHRRRGSVRAYLRQQYHYGRAEALLESKWPERYNRLGHVTWSGNVYGAQTRQRRSRRAKIGYGTWGSRLFQSVYDSQPGVLFSLSVMPEWYLLAALLGTLSVLGFAWTPLFFALPALAALIVGFVGAAVAREIKPRRWSSHRQHLTHRSVVVWLSMLQPLARLLGRLRNGLSPWRRPGARAFALPWRTSRSVWSERWSAPERWIEEVELRLLPDCRSVIRGADTDRWDLEVRAGAFGAARLLCAVEEHGRGRQLVRFRMWPRWSPASLVLPVLIAVVAIAAALDGAPVAAIVVAVAAAFSGALVLYDLALSCGLLHKAIGHLRTRASGAAPAQREAEASPLLPRAVFDAVVMESEGARIDRRL